MGSAECQFEVLVMDGRVVFRGQDVEEYVDLSDRQYVQRRMLDQERAAMLAFRAGYAVAALLGAKGKNAKTRVHRLLPAGV